MASLQQTPTKLTLEFRPWFIWIIGGFSSLIWPVQLFFLLPLIKTSTLTCTRVQPDRGECQLVTSSLLQSSKKTIPMEEFQGARVDQSDESRDRNQPQQLVLLTKHGELAFWTADTQKPQVSAIELKSTADRINDFVKNSQTSSFTIQKGNPTLAWAVTGVTTFNFLWLAYCCEIVTCDFDKSRGSVIKKRQWFFISKTVEHQLREIVDVQVQEKFNRNGKNYRIKLLLSSGKDLPLTNYYTNYLRKREYIEKKADAIAQFLGRKKL
ncbi:MULTISPECIES: transmembrane domain-containing protein [Nostocales]|uniref:DUF4564 domain-containing protein n=3 Tax=Nostocales TaxID=1161 RepID=A0A0C1QSE5_9CYAN|nr:transmembrane domain-containing protein [Tolypothrix bouteillei]KAF3885699.1 DUF4564 domain-containing protein [Tolypothrix bouteillei VB521301]